MVAFIIIALGMIFGFSIAFVFIANTLSLYSDVGEYHANYSDLSEEPLKYTVKEDSKKDLSFVGASGNNTKD